MTTYLYVGFGDFAPGVPARDLSAEEWAALGDEARALAVPLYQAIDSGEAVADGREDAGVVDDDSAGLTDGGAGHRGVRGRRRGEAEGTT